MTDLGLLDSVDTAKALFDPVGIPGQVVVHHQVRALEIDALAGGVSRKQDLYLGVVQESLLRLLPIFASKPAVDHHDGFAASEQPVSDVVVEIAEGVAVFGEDHDLLIARRCWRRNLPSAEG